MNQWVPHETTVTISHNICTFMKNIWNRIGKGKYKLSYPSLGGYVGKEEIS